MVPFRKGADGVVICKKRFEMRFEAFTYERPPRLRRFGASQLLFDAAATPPLQGGECASPKLLDIFSQVHRPRLQAPNAEERRSEERRVGKECRSRWSP